MPSLTWRTRPGRRGSGFSIKNKGSAFFISAQVEQALTEDRSVPAARTPISSSGGKERSPLSIGTAQSPVELTKLYSA